MHKLHTTHALNNKCGHTVYDFANNAGYCIVWAWSPFLHNSTPCTVYTGHRKRFS